MSAFSGNKQAGFNEQVANGGASVVYWGPFGASPIANDFLAMSSRSVSNAVGSYSYSTVNGRYLWLAIPTALAVSSVMEVNTFPVGFVTGSVTINLIPYTTYRSPDATFAAQVTVSIP